jgi:hypothetical protein
LRSTCPRGVVQHRRVRCTLDRVSPSGVMRQLSYQRWYRPASFEVRVRLAHLGGERHDAGNSWRRAAPTRSRAAARGRTWSGRRPASAALRATLCVCARVLHVEHGVVVRALAQLGSSDSGESARERVAQRVGAEPLAQVVQPR